MTGSSRDRAILRLSLRASSDAEELRLRAALAELACEDPALRVDTQPAEVFPAITGQSITQLNSACDRLRDEHHIAIEVGQPEVILLQTIRKTAEAEGKYIRQTGGSGNYGHCKLRIEPNTAGAGYEFVNDIKGGSVPKEYIKPIDQGIRGAMELGILAGYPMVDVKVILFDGSYHEVDSNEMAFKFAGSIAFKEAARKASPVLLEPVMAVEVTVPEECAASFRREIRAHRGRVKSESTFSGLTEIRALIPLAELLHTNSSTLRQSPAAFSGYEQRPGDEADGPGITANTPHRPRSRQGYERIKPEDVDPY